MTDDYLYLKRTTRYSLVVGLVLGFGLLSQYVFAQESSSVPVTARLLQDIEMIVPSTAKEIPIETDLVTLTLTVSY